jgi:SAM-dependent methyltransferase
MSFETYVRKVIRLVRPSHEVREKRKSAARIKRYLDAGGIPWSEGYHDYKWDEISKCLLSNETIETFERKEVKSFGIGLDERIVEYPWIFSRLNNSKAKFLDAGSTFNFKAILDASKLVGKEISIYTYYPEGAFTDRRISYLYGDLRDLPFRDGLFDEIVCQSTLEHIDMDNSMYGYELKSTANVKQKSYEYMKVIAELIRVLNKRGTLLLTFPYGKFENHGFFQQFDSEMLTRIINSMSGSGSTEVDYFKYEQTGWTNSDAENCSNSVSFNPHTGVGKGSDGAAHSRAIACIKFLKNI